MKKILLITVPVLVLLGMYFGIFYYRKENNLGSNEVKMYRATLVGEYLCLPHVNTSGLQTEECALGLKTDDGKYYALDFNLSSQAWPQFVSGDRIEGTGTVTPIEMISANTWQKYPIVGIFSVTDSVQKLNDSSISYECNGDAKICPDGSVVGRTGSNCEFMACPGADAGSSTLKTSLGQKVTGLNVSVTPQEIISDSRCPMDAVCIWAGTVSVRVVLATQVSHGEHVFAINEPIRFGEYTVILKEVSPYPKSSQTITQSEYRFVFEVKK